MITLFIDTSCSDVSIAILKDGKIISKKIESIPNEHSKYAVSYVDNVLKEADVLAKEVNNIMVVNGPGSFTGIRIGLTIAKIYAYLLNIEVCLVSSLKTLALSSDGEYFLSIIDAKNNNCYIGLYDKDYNEIIMEHFSNYDEVNEIINKYNNVIVISNSVIKLTNYKMIKELDIEKIVSYYKDKNFVNAHQVLPKYLKLPQVMEKNV